MSDMINPKTPNIPAEYVELLMGFESCFTSEDLAAYDKRVDEEIGKIMQAQVKDHVPGKKAYVTCPICGMKLKVSTKKGELDFTKTADRHLSVYVTKTPCLPMFDILRKRSNHYSEKISINYPAENFYGYLKRGKFGQVVGDFVIYLANPFSPDRFPIEDKPCMMEEGSATEAKLIDMGFAKIGGNDFYAWTKVVDKMIVFASPEGKDVIHFEVWDNTMPKKVIRKDVANYQIKAFNVDINGDVDLKTCFEANMNSVLAMDVAV